MTTKGYTVRKLSNKWLTNTDEALLDESGAVYVVCDHPECEAFHQLLERSPLARNCHIIQLHKDGNERDHVQSSGRVKVVNYTNLDDDDDRYVGEVLDWLETPSTSTRRNSLDGMQQYTLKSIGEKVEEMIEKQDQANTALETLRKFSNCTVC